MKETQFKVEGVFSDTLEKESVPPEQLTELDNFSAKMI